MPGSSSRFGFGKMTEQRDNSGIGIEMASEKSSLKAMEDRPSSSREDLAAREHPVEIAAVKARRSL